LQLNILSKILPCSKIYKLLGLKNKQKSNPLSIFGRTELIKSRFCLDHLDNLKVLVGFLLEANPKTGIEYTFRTVTLTQKWEGDAEKERHPIQCGLLSQLLHQTP
jgi:hypothetical protein